MSSPRATQRVMPQALRRSVLTGDRRADLNQSPQERRLPSDYPATQETWFMMPLPQLPQLSEQERLVTR